MQAQRMTGLRNNDGLTLVEMLVVLGAIVVLASFAVALTLRIENQSKENALTNAFVLLGSALHEYYEVKGEFPPQADPSFADAVAHVEFMVRQLRSVPESRRVLDKLNPSLVKSEVGLPDVPELRDPWGTVLNYVYVPKMDSFPELISAGPDKRPGTGDDISNKGRR